MNKAATIDYIMEDPREAARLEAKVDPEAWVQKYLAHRIHPGAEVLSVGCGPGVILNAVSALDSSIKATGIDISADRVQEATERNPKNPRLQFFRGDAQAMQLPSDHFDVVYSRMLLQYLREKEKAVAEMVRVCKPGGTIWILEPNGDNPLMRLLALLRPHERGLLRNSAASLSALIRGEFADARTESRQPMPVYRVLLHYRLGLPGLGRSKASIELARGWDMAVASLLPRKWWAYILLRVTL